MPRPNRPARSISDPRPREYEGELLSPEEIKAKLEERKTKAKNKTLKKRANRANP